MTHDAPLSPRPLSHLTDARPRVLTARALRAHGVSAAEADERCRPGGPWQMLLPGVFLLHPGPPTSEDRLHAALLYAERRHTLPAQGCAGQAPGGPGQAPGPEAVLTGLAALALRGFAATPPLPALDPIDVLVPRTRRLRSVGGVRILRTRTLPEPHEVATITTVAGAAGLPVAPVPRALADALARPDRAVEPRRLLTEAVRGGHSEPAAVVRALDEAGLLGRADVAEAVGALLAESRARAEGRLYDLVRAEGLPDPCWNVELRLPGGPPLGGVDAYWPQEAVAVEIDSRAPARPGGAVEDPEWRRYAHRRESLERLGITVVHLTPAKLSASPAQQAAVVRTALMAAADREPPAYVVALPR
ncbi:hypothetical protein [Streptomyces sp. JJ36]|uniref:hypothetical protein n=1 Tax=Streptomyces sp. JJ36 TaxID=2736645 RepID=UPI001F247279|nr:hypothetical protein [Streptomyces sp. JJ36]MCF6526010.1 hypothetical protein [Streptomyces sp. JJ36]